VSIVSTTFSSQPSPIHTMYAVLATRHYKQVYATDRGGGVDYFIMDMEQLSSLFHYICIYTCIYMHTAQFICEVYTHTSQCVRACIVFNVTDGVIAEGECTHSALSFQRDCCIQKISCSFCVKYILKDVNVVEASLS
jgi:hypothetical protein